MVTHSSILAWRIPGMGSHRVRHDWSDLAVAGAVGLYAIIWPHLWRLKLSPDTAKCSLGCKILTENHWSKRIIQSASGDFPGGPVVENPPSNAEVAGSIPDQGIQIPHAPRQESPHVAHCNSWTRAPQLERSLCIAMNIQLRGKKKKN